jgi:hypothetical protein
MKMGLCIRECGKMTKEKDMAVKSFHKVTSTRGYERTTNSMNKAPIPISTVESTQETG